METISTIQIGDNALTLYLENQSPVVKFLGQPFKHLSLLVEQCPPLSDPFHINEFSIISNFFWKGVQFQCIDSIPTYQHNYTERVNYELQHPADLFEYRLTDYKIFDVSVMHPPVLENDQLIFFVYNVSNGLPYRVVCPFPYINPTTVVHYQILPLKNE